MDLSITPPPSLPPSSSLLSLPLNEAMIWTSCRIIMYTWLPHQKRRKTKKIHVVEPKIKLLFAIVHANVAAHFFLSLWPHLKWKQIKNVEKKTALFMRLCILAALLDETELRNAIMSLFKIFIIFQFYYQIILVGRSDWFICFFFHSWFSLVSTQHCGFSISFGAATTTTKKKHTKKKPNFIVKSIDSSQLVCGCVCAQMHARTRTFRYSS